MHIILSRKIFKFFLIISVKLKLNDQIIKLIETYYNLSLIYLINEILDKNICNTSIDFCVNFHKDIS